MPGTVIQSEAEPSDLALSSLGGNKLFMNPFVPRVLVCNEELFFGE